MFKVHLDGNNWNLTSIANAIWWFEVSNIYKSFTFLLQGIWQWLLVKQHKVHTPQRKKMNLNYKVWFLFPNTSKFCCQINGGDQLGHLTHEILKLQLLKLCCKHDIIIWCIRRFTQTTYKVKGRKPCFSEWWFWLIIKTCMWFQQHCGIEHKVEWLGNWCVHGKNEKMKKNERHEKYNTTLLRKPSTIDLQNSKYRKIKKIKLSSHINNFVSWLSTFNTYGTFDYALHKWEIRKLTNHK